jgi:hypothetical protein
MGLPGPKGSSVSIMPFHRSPHFFGSKLIEFYNNFHLFFRVTLENLEKQEMLVFLGRE